MQKEQGLGGRDKIIFRVYLVPFSAYKWKSKKKAVGFVNLELGIKQDIHSGLRDI